MLAGQIPQKEVLIGVEINSGITNQPERTTIDIKYIR